MATETNNNSNNNAGNAAAHNVTGTSGGTHVMSTPLTTELVDAARPGLLVNSIDKAVTRIRPMATPLDQISRMGHVRPVDSMEVEYYSVDTRPDKATVQSFAPVSGGADAEHQLLLMKTSADELFEPSETFIIESDSAPSPVVGYVVARDAAGLTVMLESDDAESLEGGRIVRMGRAATQLDVQSPQFSVLPVKRSNQCQIFKMQIEQSTTLRRSHKEVGWDFSDQQEAAVYDMRLGMEKQFLFGRKLRFYDHIKGETVLLTEGIWNQAGKDITLSLDRLDNGAIVDLLRDAFTENSGSRRKVLIGGSALITALNKVESTRVVTSQDQVTRWGIDFTELQSKFGRLYVVFSDVFDAMGHASDGIIVDPEYIQKHVFTPFSAERIDLRGSGQRNTEALVLTECSCLTLRYPEAHARVTGC